MATRSPRAAACSLVGLLLAAAACADPVDLQPFRATYSVEWKSITAGTAVLELKSVAPGRWEYANVNKPRGLFKLALPESIRMASSFRLDGDRIQPLSFHGSDEKQRPTELVFDWPAHRVTGQSKGHAVDLEIPDGAQDPMSLQIAALRGLANVSLADSVWLVDGDQLKDYVLANEGREGVETHLGRFECIVYSSRSRDGDRVTRTWVAPALGYLPVKAERIRGGKLEFTLLIESKH